MFSTGANADHYWLLFCAAKRGSQGIILSHRSLLVSPSSRNPMFRTPLDRIFRFFFFWSFVVLL